MKKTESRNQEGEDKGTPPLEGDRCLCDRLWFEGWGLQLSSPIPFFVFVF